MEFVEELNATSPPYRTTNPGRWYYDWPNRRARYEHDLGQRNDFCQLSMGLAPPGTTGPACRLYFTESQELWVAYPEEQRCCSLCWPNPQGFPAVCGALRKDWLSGATYMGTIPSDDGDKPCFWWQKEGAVATDNWYVRADGMPCQYREHYRGYGANIDNITDHRISYDSRTFRQGADSVDPAVFKLPSYCNQNCTLHPNLAALREASSMQFAGVALSFSPVPEPPAPHELTLQV